MPEPFKNFFSQSVIQTMAQHFKRCYPAFNDTGFVGMACDNLDDLALKQRSAQITQAMVAFFPEDFEHAARIILASLRSVTGHEALGMESSEAGLAGWEIMPITHYVGLKGLGHFDLGMVLFKELTKRFSSEFGIRFFLLEYPEQSLTTLQGWISDESHHVRRLISEGTRPRLPWAVQLPAFVKNPKPLLPILEKLKDDSSEYVRRSVANHLNDIAKDHPNLVAITCQSWMKNAGKDRKKLIRHACRTLLKQGHPLVLKIFGYHPPELSQVALNLEVRQVAIGNLLGFDLNLESKSDTNQNLMIDYVVHHQKANGKLTPKVFKWRTVTLQARQTAAISKTHSFKKVTTRVYYPGAHLLEILVNGVSVARQEFELLAREPH